MTKLFEKDMLEDIKVNNRVFIATRIRNRAHPHGTPYAMKVKYHVQVVNANSTVDETTQRNAKGQVYIKAPDFYNENYAENIHDIQ